MTGRAVALRRRRLSRLSTKHWQTTKADRRCDRAAVVVFRVRKRRLEFLLVSRKSNPEQFVLPGGHIDDDETLTRAARRECLEEAGVEAHVLGPLIRYEHHTARGNAKPTMTFLAEAESISESSEGREVIWARHDDLVAGLLDVPYATLDVLDYAAQCLRKKYKAA